MAEVQAALQPGAEGQPAQQPEAEAQPAQPQYEYTVLADLLYKEPGRRHVWASVVECSVPRPTKGTDLVSNMTLVDPSLVSEEGLEEESAMTSGVELLFFSSEVHQMPQIRRQGDLIRFHRVQTKAFNGKAQLVAKVGPGQPCHFCLFDGAIGGPEEPYQRSSNTFTMDTADKEFLAYLREFFQENTPTGTASKYLKRIRDLQPGVFVDICCWVLAQEEGSPLDKTFYVWDGTDARPFSLGEDTSTNEGPDGQPIFEENSLCRRAMPLTGSVVSEIPPLGSALPVMLYKPVAPEDKAEVAAKFKNAATYVPPPELPAVGSWVKLRNIGIVLVGGQIQGLYHRSSKWVPWQPGHQALSSLQQRVNSNHVATWAPDDERELVTRWSSPARSKTPYTTLRRVLQQADAGVAKSYKCLVRLLNYIPAESTAFCKQAQGIGGLTGDWHFKLKLHLQDATGELDALLFGQEASTFFGGVAPQDLGQNVGVAAALQQKMEVAAGVASTSEGRTWLDCCLQCFFTDDLAAKDLSSAKFQIVDTALV